MAQETKKTIKVTQTGSPIRRTDGQREVLLSTKQGMIIRFPEDEVRPMGRTAAGVRGIDVDEGDQVIAAETLK